MNDTTKEIKEKLSVVDVVGEYVELKQAGVNFKGACPFHDEKTPSFVVSEEKQIWHCFGCAKGGDIYTFVQEIENIEFKEALEILAKKAGVEIKQYNTNKKKNSKADRIYDMLELTTKFFQKALEVGKTAQPARDYVNTRGMTPHILDTFQVGFAPDSYDALQTFLAKKGYTTLEMLEAGLVGKNNRGNYFDKFRNRIIFPIKDVHGRTVGYGGRIMEKKENAPKYLNSPESKWYQKRELLYGLNWARQEARKKGFVIVVEGYMDVIASHKADYINVVASSGTALSREQIELLNRYTDTLYFCFDMDEAGKQATLRGIDHALQADMKIKIVTIPEGSDPDDLVSKDPKLWHEAIESAKPLVDHYIEDQFASFDPQNIEEKEEKFTFFTELLAKIQSKVRQEHYTKILAEKLGIGESIIRNEIAQKREKSFKVAPPIQERTQPDKELPETLLARDVLSLILYKPKRIAALLNTPFEFILPEPDKTLVQKVKAYYTEHSKAPDALDARFVLKNLEEEDESLKDRANQLIMIAEEKLEQSGQSIKSDEYYQQIRTALERIILKKQLQNLTNAMKKAEMSGDTTAMNELAAKSTQITTKLTKLQ